MNDGGIDSINEKARKHIEIKGYYGEYEAICYQAFRIAYEQAMLDTVACDELTIKLSNSYSGLKDSFLELKSKYVQVVKDNKELRKENKELWERFHELVHVLDNFWSVDNIIAPYFQVVTNFLYSLWKVESITLHDEVYSIARKATIIVDTNPYTFPVLPYFESFALCIPQRREYLPPVNISELIMKNVQAVIGHGH